MNTITYWKLVKGSEGQFHIKIDDDDFMIRKIQNSGKYVYMSIPHSIIREIIKEVKANEVIVNG